jgi:opacity protein-like surface antigen
MSFRKFVFGLALGLVVAPVSDAFAQGFGIGPHWSFVRGDVTSGKPSTRLFGGSIRIASSKRVVLEVSLDQRTELAADGKSRLRERPLQGSMLMFLARSTFSPYLLGGYGIYSQTTDILGTAGAVTSSTMERKTGAHMGFGAELFLGRHAALYLDYRYRFVSFGEPAADEKELNIPGKGIIPGADAFNLSHKGTMFTSGVAFYF